MTAAAERARLAEIGGHLSALSGGSGWRRGRALLGDRPDVPVSFADLARAPAWLGRSRSELRELAVAAALIAMAPAIAASIDGDWLGELAERAGEGALDRAIAQADRVPEGGLPPRPAAEIEALGFALMRAMLPSPLRRYLAWAPAGSIEALRDLAVFCIDEAADG